MALNKIQTNGTQPSQQCCALIPDVCLVTLIPYRLLPVGSCLVWAILTGRGRGIMRSGVGVIPDAALCAIMKGKSGRCSVVFSIKLPTFGPLTMRTTWPFMARCRLLKAKTQATLRRLQHVWVQVDELCPGMRIIHAWFHFIFASRLGVNPRQLILTTLRPSPLFFMIVGAPASNARPLAFETLETFNHSNNNNKGAYPMEKTM